MSRTLIIIIIACFSFSFSFSLSLYYFLHYWWDHPYQYFAYQAQSWLQGRLDVPIDRLITTIDFNFFKQHFYWPQGPFPSIILLPLELIPNLKVAQSIMQLILILTLATALFSLARLKNYSNSDSLALSLAFLIASPMINIITSSGSSQYAQLVAVTLLTLTLYILETRRQPLVLGLLTAGLLATRPTSAIIFFPILILLGKHTRSLLFVAPVTVTSLLLGLYNFVRFGNILDNGYATNNLNQSLSTLRQAGLFSPSHIPTNFWYYFIEPINLVWNNQRLSPPYLIYNQWGLSLFLIAPFFLYSLATFKHLTPYLKLLWLTVAITLITLLLYFNTGWSQFGPRYSADFMPIIFLLTLYAFKPPRLGILPLIIITLSSILNVYLQYSYQLQIPK